MPTLQYFDIKDSKVKVVNEDNDPVNQQQQVDALLAAKLAQTEIQLLEQTQLTASLALELAQLKSKGEN